MTTYAQLQSDIIAEFWDDSTELAAFLPELIARAEDRLADDLITNQFESNTTTATAIGVSTIAIPSDLRTLRYVRLTRANGTKKFLQRQTTEYVMDYDDGTQGEPKYYADYTPSTYILAPQPNAVLNVEIGYRRRLERLSDSNPSNWYTEEAYNVIFFAIAIEVASYLKSEEERVRYTDLYIRAAERLNNRSRTDDRDDLRVPQRKITQENVEGR